MKVISLIFFLVLIAGQVFAQPTGFSLYRPSVFQPDWDEFRVEVQGTLALSGNKDEKSSRKYNSSKADPYLYVSSDPISSLANFAKIAEFARNNGNVLVSIPNEAFRRNTYRYLDSFGYYNTVSICRSFARVYVFQATSKTRDNASASTFIGTASCSKSGPGKESLIEDWKPAPEGSKNPTDQEPNVQQVVAIEKPEIKMIDGKPATSALRITRQVRPGYTELATFYLVEGTVKVRVLFLATGRIGKVETMSHLPFGLTDQAVNAAKAIEFEPSYRDGIPQTIVKHVEYTFAIF